ncbi:MAG: hypothetical protein PHV43_02315 [Candidatus Colwellbacteria bacterium]|nr:hypothetical protein [Candidatus Colwellbacteria bacterium]
MRKWILPIRAQDEVVFNAIKDGTKTVETRAYLGKYARIEEGDTLVLSCAGKKFEKKVKQIRLFPSVEDMYKEIDYKKVIPWADSLEGAIGINKSFPNYEERLKKGIIAWNLI